MSLFLVGGGYDDSLVEVYDEFVSQARHHNADAPIAVVVAGPPSESADHAAELTRIVTSRWVDANILTIHLDGPGTAPTVGDPATPLWAEDESFQLPDNLDALAGIIVDGALSLAVACPLEVLLVVSPEYRMLRAIKTSTRRFWARPSSVSFDAIGRYSLYPSALKRAGFNVGCAVIRPRIRLTARAELSSQFEGNCAVEIGTLSVCPEIVTRSGSDERSAAMTGTICSA